MCWVSNVGPTFKAMLQFCELLPTFVSVGKVHEVQGPQIIVQLHNRRIRTPKVRHHLIEHVVHFVTLFLQFPLWICEHLFYCMKRGGFVVMHSPGECGGAARWVDLKVKCISANLTHSTNCLRIDRVDRCILFPSLP